MIVYPPKSNELSKAPKSINQQQTNGVDWFREALPMEIRIVTGSLILGSDATPMVLIGDFKRADGVLEVTDVRRPSLMPLTLVTIGLRQV
jgi:hypothetical protein